MSKRSHTRIALTATSLLAVSALMSPAATASSAPSGAHFGGTAAASQPKAWGPDAVNTASSREGTAPAKASYFASYGKVVLYYNDANAPSYRSLIASAASIWNSSLTRVQLVRTTGSGDIRYYEGNFGDAGSTARWSSPGHGTINIDYAQTNTYSPLRVVAHETGHVIGSLPDHYSGPCSELMSGGGPGPGCTSPYPNASERQRTDANY